MPTLTVNKRVSFEYEVLEKLSAGIVLTGHETKSIKQGRVNISGAHAIPRGNELYLVGMEIPSFQPKNAPSSHDAGRTKKLLLTRSEISYVIGKIQSGIRLVPLRAYTEKNKIKIELALVRTLKKHDKREIIKKREIEQELQKSTRRK